MLFFAAAGIFFAKLVLDNPTRSELSIFLAIMTLHPFGTEFFTFSDATLNIMIGLLLSAAGAFLAARSSNQWVSIGIATLLLIAALSIYQTTIAYVLPLCLIALVVRISRRELPAFQQPFFQWPEFRALIVVLASVVVYLAVAKLISHVSGVPLDGRTDFAGLVDVKAKLSIVWTALTLALWPMPGLLPAGASILLIVLLTISTILVIFPMLRNGLVLSGILCAAMLAAGLGWAVGASAVGKVIWLVPRVLAPMSAFAAGLIMVGWHLASLRSKALFGVASVVLVLAYIGSSNRILSEQHRLNHWDAQQANRIVDRLERHPRFVDIRSLAIIGGDWRRSARLVTTTGDMNVSAFFSRPSKLGLIQEASGYRFEKTTATEYTDAEQYCQTAPHFPADASVTVLGSVGIVCLVKLE
ncbi:hypothetical protein AXW83_22555 [Bosea sp. PAMC 26642]|nr:hypothetical protein AXW83_22555 [Bosea sp. PAMC 26642]